MGSALVLIDGENFVHSLIDVLGERTRVLNCNIRQLLQRAMGRQDLEIVYFGTTLRLNTASGKLLKKVEQARQFQARWVNVLTAQEISFVKAGYLRAREGETCVKCGNQEPYLLEKGVDVALAVRATQAAVKGKEIVIISSDTDLLPAYFAAQSSGAKVTYVGFEKNMIYALAATADSKVCITKKMILGAMQQGGV